jgi:hypothetical protein
MLYLTPKAEKNAMRVVNECRSINVNQKRPSRPLERVGSLVKVSSDYLKPYCLCRRCKLTKMGNNAIMVLPEAAEFSCRRQVSLTAVLTSERFQSKALRALAYIKPLRKIGTSQCDGTQSYQVRSRFRLQSQPSRAWFSTHTHSWFE